MSSALTLAILVWSTGATGPEGVHQKLAASARAMGATAVEHAIETAVATRREGWRSRASLGFFGEVRQKLDEGRRARERVELDAALNAYESAEASCAAHAGEPGIDSFAAEAALDRGVVLAELRRSDEAKAAFKRALDAAPALQLTERSARPDVVRLFKQIAAQPRSGVARPPDPHVGDADALAASLAALSSRPDPVALQTLRESLDADAIVVGVVSVDGTSVLAQRVEAACASAIASYGIDELDAAKILSAKCEPNGALVSLDDPRLRPAPIAVVVQKPAVKPKKKIWPWVFVGALGVTAAVIGVTVGVLASDPKYTVKVDGRTFGAP